VHSLRTVLNIPLKIIRRVGISSINLVLTHTNGNTSLKENLNIKKNETVHL
jgi:hypothetical protein